MSKASVVVYSHSITVSDEFLRELNEHYEIINIKAWTTLRALIGRTRPHCLIVILDAQDGELLKMLESHKGQLPFGLVVLTSSYSITNERLAFKIGADHYLLLSTPQESIIRRVQNLISRMDQLRRSHNTISLPVPAWRDGYLKVGGFEVEAKSGLILQGGHPLILTPIQSKLLSIFIQQPDQILTREDLRRLAWPESKISDRSIDAHIAKLRKSVPALKEALQGVYGRGYMFIVEKLIAA